MQDKEDPESKNPGEGLQDQNADRKHGQYSQRK